MTAQDGHGLHIKNILSQKFDNPQDEIAFLRSKLEETYLEFQEFQESSRELETEYETQVQQLDAKNSELINQISRLEDENNQLRTRYNAYTNDTQHKLNEYQQQVSEFTALNDRLTSYIRELEQSNDDLERARRALAASLEDFEGQLNQQIERNVLLENEVSEKEELECVVQRLKEETRDLRHELIANKNSSDPTRRKLIFDNYITTSQKDSSLQSGTAAQKLDSNNIVTKLDDGASLNGMSSPQNNSQASDIQTSTGSSNQKPPNVDSTTSPMAPQATSRFSFSSSFSNSKSSPTKSTDSKSQQTSSPSSPTLPSITLSPSSRVTALNIVSDLLRKVGVLESKLASAKKVTA